MKEFARRFHWLSRHEFWVLPLTLGLVYFIVQLSMIGQYGATWDEPLHRNWGLLYSLFSKTGDRSVLYMMPGNGVYYSPLYFFANYELSYWLVHSHGWLLVPANHVLTIVTSSLVVAFSYLLGRLFGGWKTGLLTVVFLLGFPQFIAHSHYNPKDIPLMLAVLATSFTFLLALRKGSRKLLLVSAALFGCSLAAKVTALMLAPVFLVSYLFWLFSQPRSQGLRRFLEREILLGLTALLLVIGFTILCWPSSWGDIHLLPSSVAFFLRSDFWSGNVQFLGEQYAGADLPWYYTPLEYLMGMPLLMVCAFVLGAALSVMRLRVLKDRPACSFLLLWVFLPLFLTLMPDLVRYDGMRQFFFLLPAIAVLAAVGFQRIIGFLSARFRYAEAACVLVLLVSLIHEIVILHPFEGSYRNEVVRMVFQKDMEKSLQIEYWGASYKQGMDWLTEHAAPNPVICVPTAGALIDWYPWRSDFAFDCSKETNYLMFFTRYDEPSSINLSQLTPAFTIERMGATLLKIYQF